MKILRPVLVEKRLPAIEKNDFLSPTVLIRFVNPDLGPNWSCQCFAYCDSSGRWEDAEPFNKYKFDNGITKVVEWYEEIEIESLFPDTDNSYNVAKAAADNRIAGITLHQEGQDFLKNHILKQLGK
jgi:hypothetical protein